MLSAGSRDPIPFRVLVDGQVRGRSHGVDVDGNGNGNGVLHAGRMYQLVHEPGTVREQTVQVSFLEPGAEAHVFTFG